MAQEPYKHQAWPSWRYHPETGEGAIFESESDVPKGWVDSLTKVGEAASEAPPKAKRKATPKKEKAKPEPAPVEDDNDDEGEAPTLKSLGMSRKEVLEILDEEGVKYAAKATNDQLAALVKDLLEDDEDSE